MSVGFRLLVKTLRWTRRALVSIARNIGRLFCAVCLASHIGDVNMIAIQLFVGYFHVEIVDDKFALGAASADPCALHVVNSLSKFFCLHRARAISLYKPRLSLSISAAPDRCFLAALDRAKSRHATLRSRRRLAIGRRETMTGHRHATGRRRHSRRLRRRRRVIGLRSRRAIDRRDTIGCCCSRRHDLVVAVTF